MSNYTFVTNWRLDASITDVWEEITHSEQWPEWWKAVKSVVKLAEGDPQGVGAIHMYTWRGALPYELSFNMTTTVVDRCRRLEGVANGELCGRGRWTFSGDDRVAIVRYDWEVETTKTWMRILTPIARPLFEWNHDVVMRWGFDGLVPRLRSRRKVHG